MKPTKPKFKKCRSCSHRFQVFRSTQKVCSLECGIELARVEADKKEKAESRKNRKALRDYNRKDLRWQHKQTQKAFNRMRVLQELEWFKKEGKEPECISCGKKYMDWCCGHLKTVGAQPALRYDELNSFLQCNRYCNMGLSGNIEGNKTTRGYKQGLKDRFSINEAYLIIEHCESHRDSKNWTWQELEDMRKQFNQEIRRVENDT